MKPSTREGSERKRHNNSKKIPLIFVERKIDKYLKSNYVKAMTGQADINSQLTLD